MDEVGEKAWYTSKTIWAQIVGVVAAVATAALAELSRRQLIPQRLHEAPGPLASGRGPSALQRIGVERAH